MCVWVVDLTLFVFAAAFSQLCVKPVQPCSLLFGWDGSCSSCHPPSHRSPPPHLVAGVPLQNCPGPLQESEPSQPWEGWKTAWLVRFLTSPRCLFRGSFALLPRLLRGFLCCPETTHCSDGGPGKNIHGKSTKSVAVPHNKQSTLKLPCPSPWPCWGTSVNFRRQSKALGQPAQFPAWCCTRRAACLPPSGVSRLLPILPTFLCPCPGMRLPKKTTKPNGGRNNTSKK